MVQPGAERVLVDAVWAKKLASQDRRALSALFWTHANPYGRFEFDMSTRINLDAVAA